MSTFRSPTPGFLDRITSRDLAYGRPSASARADIAVLGPSDCQTRSSCLECRDPFTYSKALPGANYTLGGAENDVPCNTYGNTSCRGAACCVRRPANDDGRADPYSVSVRFANRSNGLPLATIVEKGSNSTLHSHRSLLSLTSQYPLARSSISAVSVLHSHRTSRSLDETALHRIQEHTHPEQYVERNIDDHACPDPGSAISFPKRVTNIVPVTSPVHQHQTSRISQLSNSDVDGTGLRGHVRGVMQHAWGTSSPDDRLPLSFLHSSSVSEPGQHAPRQGNYGPYTGRDVGDSPASRTKGVVCCVSPDLGPPLLPMSEASETWAENCERSLSNTNAPGPCVLPVIPHAPPDNAGPPDDLVLPPLVSASSSLSLPIQHNRGSIPISPARRGEPDYVDAEVPTSSQGSRGDSTDRYTVDGTAIYRSNPSQHEYDSVREVSFCGTDSTSYSGTVLGIDLDLPQDSSSTPLRSSTPVWFGVSAPIQPQSHTEPGMRVRRPQPSRSITSSALPVLLPLAAASGIVQPNLATARLSYYSPSGNLIQAEGSSSSASPYASHYQNTASFPEPSARPAAIPLTTPPQSSMRVPSHVMQKQHHHHHRAHTHIVPQTGATTSRVKGCGGIVRTNSFTPRSGILRRSSSNSSMLDPRKAHRSTSARFRSRFFAVAFCTGFQPPGDNGLQARKINTLNSKHEPARNYSSSPGFGLAGRTLRVCFCQPWDGAGTRSSRRLKIGRLSDDGCHDEADHTPDENTHDVPARIVAQMGRRKQ